MRSDWGLNSQSSPEYIQQDSLLIAPAAPVVLACNQLIKFKNMYMVLI